MISSNYGIDKKLNNIFNKIADIENHFIASLNEDTSFCGEYTYLKYVINELGISEGYVVDIAASDGVTQSSTLGFFKDSRWGGLAVEMDPNKFSKLAFIYEQFSRARLARGRITPSNVNAMLMGFEVPQEFTILNLDIDSYDYFVIEEMLKFGFRPLVISMEVNEKIPPPIFFTVKYEDAHYWSGDHFFGCSLTAAAKLLKPFGYILESLQYNNAIFIRSDIANGKFSDANVNNAYDNGYRNKINRALLFPWNHDVDCLLDYTADDSVKFIYQFFNKYSGKFTLYI